MLVIGHSTVQPIGSTPGPFSTLSLSGDGHRPFLGGLGYFRCCCFVAKGQGLKTQTEVYT